eukprot:6686284-Pyramimonas_sp.AAC.1
MPPPLLGPGTSRTYAAAAARMLVRRAGARLSAPARSASGRRTCSAGRLARRPCTGSRTAPASRRPSGASLGSSGMQRASSAR